MSNAQFVTQFPDEYSCYCFLSSITIESWCIIDYDESMQIIDYNIGNKRRDYLGGFAGGSAWLLHSESEKPVFLRVVIIRGGFGGPWIPFGLMEVAEFCCRSSFRATPTHRDSAVATLGCDSRLKSSPACVVLLGSCGFECCLCRSILPELTRPYTSSRRRSFGCEVTSGWERPVFEGYLFRALIKLLMSQRKDIALNRTNYLRLEITIFSRLGRTFDLNDFKFVRTFALKCNISFEAYRLVMKKTVVQNLGDCFHFNNSRLRRS